MDEDKPLPMGRSVTINRSFFWIFLAAMLVLYVSNKILTIDIAYGTTFSLNDILIMGATFVSLLLNLITISVTDNKLNKMLTIVCYGFEIASIIIMAFMVFILT